MPVVMGKRGKIHFGHGSGTLCNWWADGEYTYINTSEIRSLDESLFCKKCFRSNGVRKLSEVAYSYQVSQAAKAF
jgi:hypothetical protein